MVRAFEDGAHSVARAGGRKLGVGDVFVVATGRRPRTEGLGLEELDVTFDDHGALVVDEHCYAGAGIWGVGDVTGKAMFTHVAKYQARIATAGILGTPRVARYDSIPRVVFGHPEIAAVGLTEERAVAAGRRIRVSEVDLTAALARPWTYEETPTGASLGLLADADAGLLLGCMGRRAAGERVDPPGRPRHRGGDPDRAAARPRAAVPVVQRGLRAGPGGTAGLGAQQSRTDVRPGLARVWLAPALAQSSDCTPASSCRAITIRCTWLVPS